MNTNCFLLIATDEMRVVEIIPDWQDASYVLGVMDRCEFPVSVVRAHESMGVITSDHYAFDNKREKGTFISIKQQSQAG